MGKDAGERGAGDQRFTRRGGPEVPNRGEDYPGCLPKVQASGEP